MKDKIASFAGPVTAGSNIQHPTSVFIRKRGYAGTSRSNTLTLSPFTLSLKTLSRPTLSRPTLSRFTLSPPKLSPLTLSRPVVPKLALIFAKKDNVACHTASVSDVRLEIP